MTRRARRLTNSSSTSSDFEYFGSAPMSNSFDYGYGLAQSGYSSPTGYDSPPIGFFSANNTSSTAINTNTTTSSSSSPLLSSPTLGYSTIFSWTPRSNLKRESKINSINRNNSDISRGEIVKNTEKTIQIIQFEDKKEKFKERITKAKEYSCNDEKTGLFVSHRRTLGVMFLTAIVSDLESVVEYEQLSRLLSFTSLHIILELVGDHALTRMLYVEGLISSITDEIINEAAIVFSRAYPEIVAGKVKSSGLSCILINLQY
ncbi:3625_t:CDS:2 [Entrophospora sp. SA101]|nr:3625_t:CDS:2 [Entrophospora sp. SA101]